MPTKDARIFPGDILGVIGTDEQIQHLNEDIESFERASEELPVYNSKIELCSIQLSETSPIIGKNIVEARIRQDYYSMVVKIQRGDNLFIQPTATTVFEVGDTIWIVGELQNIEKLK